MQICNDADLDTEYSFLQNQNITGKAPRLLPCSSIASCPDQGSDLITTSQTGEEKEYPDHKWYYMFLRNRELKRYIEIFTGRRAVMMNTRSGIKEERYFCFKVFSYTSADHKRRFERCPYSKEEYAARRESAFAVKEAFATGSVCAPLDELNLILAHLFPRQYLAKDRNSYSVAVIPHRQMEEFIYLYESMPYNIELMDKPLEEYIQKKQKIRITGGVFQGKEGCIMRLHRNTKLVFAFGNMTVAISYLQAFPFEKVE